MTRICVFASGNGSNFKSIYNSTREGGYSGEVVLLISNNPKCGAVQFSQENSITTEIFNKHRYSNFDEYSEKLLQLLKKYKIDLILLAGYMKKIPSIIVREFQKHILNIHPALLPKYGGKGFFGNKVHEAVLESGDKITGVTIHFVNNEYDSGAIVAQKTVSVLPGDSPCTLAERVLKEEHRIFPEVTRAFCENRIIWKNNKPIILSD